MSWRIVNLVATGNLNQRVDLQDIAGLSYTIHDPGIYGGRVAYLKTPEMDGKVSIFPSGKLISVGTTSPENAQSDLEHTVSVLSSAGLIEPVIVRAVIRNIVVLLQIKIMGLEKIAEFLDSIYEPEQFPGVIYKPKDIDATYLIFNSGKIIIAGIKTIDLIKTAIEYIESTINGI